MKSGIMVIKAMHLFSLMWFPIIGLILLYMAPCNHNSHSWQTSPD